MIIYAFSLNILPEIVFLPKVISALSIYLSSCVLRLKHWDAKRIGMNLNKPAWELGKNVEIINEREKADLYVVNTCTVTHVADQKSRQAARHFKSINPHSKVAVFGCGVTVDEGKMFSQLPEVDFILRSRQELVDLIAKLRKSTDIFQKEHIKDDMRSTHTLSYEGGDYSPTRTRALLKIQDGCNAFCSYCVIPMSRGRARSFSLKKIIREAQEKEAAGFQEIVLTGINIGTWQEDDKTIAHVIEALLEKTSFPRIRISSIEPTSFSDQFFALLTNPRICPHIHMCLQSGCDAILKKMRRLYTTSLFKDIAFKMFSVRPELALTTDVIVGFPGETKKDFYYTKAFCKEISCAKIHVFPYSKRRRTQAFYMPDQISYREKMQRSKDLQLLSKQLRTDYIKRFLGSIQEVLFEEQKETGVNEGYTGNYIKVMLKSSKNIANTIKKVKLTALVKEEKMTGELQ